MGSSLEWSPSAVLPYWIKKNSICAVAICSDMSSLGLINQLFDSQTARRGALWARYLLLLLLFAKANSLQSTQVYH